MLDGLADAGLFQLDRGMAVAADQELTLMRVFRVIAAHERVERRDAVHEAVFQQEIQCPVNGRRRGAAAGVDAWLTGSTTLLTPIPPTARPLTV